jgi:hypothetical protein
MTHPLSFDDLQAILYQGLVSLPDSRKPSPNTRYTIQDAALVLRFRNNVMVGLPFFHQSIGSPALVTWTLIVKRST